MANAIPVVKDNPVAKSIATPPLGGRAYTATGTSVPTVGAEALLYSFSNTELRASSPNVQETITAYVLRFTTLGTTYPRLYTRASLGIGVAGVQALATTGIRSRYLQAGGDADDYSSAITTAGVFTGRQAKASRITRWNGTQTSISSTATTGTEPALTDSFNMFDWNGTGINFVAEVAAVGLFTGSTWSQTLAEKIEGYVAHQGIGGLTTAILPAGHPYKTTAPTV